MSRNNRPISRFLLFLSLFGSALALIPAYAQESKVITIGEPPPIATETIQVPPGEGGNYESLSGTPLPPPEVAAPALEESKPVEGLNGLRLRGLNKMTARLSVIEAPLGTVMHFGNLEIIATRCWQAPADKQPENAALLQVRELRPGEAPAIIFSGWMFSSSPALNGLEHPVYDITVLECIAVKLEPEAEAQETKKSKKP